MPVVNCPHCAKGVTLPDPWTAPVYTCPHCNQTVATSRPAPPAARKPAPAPLAFDTDDDQEEDAPARRSAPRRTSYGSTGGTSWGVIFTATLAANVLAGVILLIGVRAYVYWSIQDSMEKIRNQPTQTR